jgi:hypothetical protein
VVWQISGPASTSAIRRHDLEDRLRVARSASPPGRLPDHPDNLAIIAAAPTLRPTSPPNASATIIKILTEGAARRASSCSTRPAW